MFHAHRSGCSMVKLFPAGIIGPEYIKNILAPLPELKIVGTGGVQFDDISVKKWFASGITALGIGSSIFTKERLTKKDYKSIEEDLKRIMAIN
jgi:2-dehydro-3-deoxyphosphogluconate aldolase/(4S)-4-hydroxy-2-oxoglutarate aldolase